MPQSPVPQPTTLQSNDVSLSPIAILHRKQNETRTIKERIQACAVVRLWLVALTEQTKEAPGSMPIRARSQAHSNCANRVIAPRKREAAKPSARRACAQSRPKEGQRYRHRQICGPRECPSAT